MEGFRFTYLYGSRSKVINRACDLIVSILIQEIRLDMDIISSVKPEVKTKNNKIVEKVLGTFHL